MRGGLKVEVMGAEAVAKSTGCPHWACGARACRRRRCSSREEEQTAVCMGMHLASASAPGMWAPAGNRGLPISEKRGKANAGPSSHRSNDRGPLGRGGSGIFN